MIVGREDERAAIDAFVAGISRGARALVIRGEPGMGKTTLWHAALEQCRTAGHDVRAVRPGHDGEAPLLAPLADLGLAGAPPSGGMLADGRAVLADIRASALRRPLVVAIDDLHELDRASAGALRYALRRLDGEAVGALVTLRPAPHADDELDLGATLPPGRCTQLELGPLGLADLRAVLAGVVSSLSKPLLVLIHETSGGNPRYAIELARGLRSEERDAGGRHVLTLPASLEAEIGERLDAAPGELVPGLEALAALGAAGLDDLDDALLATGRRTGLLTLDESGAIRLSQPLVALAVNARMSPGARRALHARLAASIVDADARARHLALSVEGPAPEAAAHLEAAGQRAGARGAHAVAAELAHAAVRLTPADDRDARTRRSLTQIAHLAAGGEVGAALSVAERLADALPPGPGRAEALLCRARLGDVDSGETLLERALDDAGDDDALRARILSTLGWLRGHVRGDVGSGAACSREALAVAELLDDAGLLLEVEAGLSHLLCWAGTPRPDLIASAIDREETLGRPLLRAGPRVLSAEQRLWSGELRQARALLDAALADADRSANEWLRPYLLCDLAAVECAAGELQRAHAHAREAKQGALDSGDVRAALRADGLLAHVAAWLGRAGEARTAAWEQVREAERRGERPALARSRLVLGLLALSEDDGAAAARELTEAVRLLDEMGVAHPGAIPALPDAVESLAQSGDTGAAARLLDRLEVQARALGSHWVGALAERSRGHLLLAVDEVDAAIELLARAMATFDALGHRPDAARAALARGEALLRAGRRTHAADALAEARDRFASMGATLWTARAAATLERAAPGRASGQLTPYERRIAGLVAQGLRNRQIAQALFISVATVEGHLTRTYRKLQIRSRSELVRLVVEGTVSIDPDPTG